MFPGELHFGKSEFFWHELSLSLVKIKVQISDSTLIRCPNIFTLGIEPSLPIEIVLVAFFLISSI